MNPLAALLAGLSGAPGMAPQGTAMPGVAPLMPTTQLSPGGGPGGAISPGTVNPMHRALMGFGAGMMTARPGLTAGQAFAQGLGGSLMGGFAYDGQQSQLARQAEQDRRQRENDDFSRRTTTLGIQDRQENTGLRRRQIEDQREYRDRELDVRREGVRARAAAPNRQAWADPQGTLLRIERDVDTELRESGARPGTPQHAEERARRIRERRVAVFGTDNTEDIYRRSQTYGAQPGGASPSPSGGGFVAPPTDEAVD
jgi:hypothetical protein